MAKGAKKPIITERPRAQKQPRIAVDPSTDGLSPTWSFRHVDIGSPWCFSQVPQGDWVHLLAKLKHFEGLTWAQIGQNTGSHPVEINKLIPEARKRLTELGHGDREALYSLRVNGRPRIWGIRDGVVLRVIWWDGEHRICPSTKKTK
jgi:hypothetical protein